jgi:hypothetical protein
MALIGSTCVVMMALRPPALAGGRVEAGDGGAPLPWCNDPAIGALRLYVSGAEQNYVAYFGQQLASLATPITIVYQKTGSCVGVNSIAGTGAVTQMTGTAAYVDATGTLHNCTFTPPPNDAGLPNYAPVDIGVSDVFASSCGVMTLPSNTLDTWGPISPAVFVTSPGSNQQAISAEIAYVALGVQNGTSTPWTIPADLMTRGPGSGTQVLLSDAVGVPANQWWGVNVGATGNALIASTLAGLTAAPDVNAGLAALSTAYAQTYSTQVKILAFQAHGQIAAFWPGRTSTSLDMQNVRDGHYVPWGQIHFFTNLVNGQPTATANAVISRLTGGVPDQSLIDLAAAQSCVPQCAMKVRRMTEIGAVQPFIPPLGCGCYFEFKATGSAPAGCTMCQTAADCPAARPVCNYGYCEVQ